MSDRHDRQIIEIGQEGQDLINSGRVAILGVNQNTISLLEILVAIGIQNLDIYETKKKESFFIIDTNYKNADIHLIKKTLNRLDDNVNINIYQNNINNYFLNNKNYDAIIDFRLNLEDNLMTLNLLNGNSNVPVFLTRTSDDGYRYKVLNNGLISESFKNDFYKKSNNKEHFLMSHLMASSMAYEIVKHILNHNNYKISNTSFKINHSDKFNILDFNLRHLDHLVTSRKDILLVGAGAVGNQFARNISKLTKHSLTIVDYDHIENSNLSRQILFCEHKVGDYKSELLAECCQSINPYSQINSIVGGVNKSFSENNFKNLDLDWFKGKKFDLIVSAVDSWKARNFLNQVAKHYKIPLINGGCSFKKSDAMIYVPSQTNCLECSIPKLSDYIKEEVYQESVSCSDRKTPSSIIMSNIAASNMMFILMQKYFKPITYGQVKSGNYRFNSDLDFKKITFCEDNSICKCT